MKRAIILFLFLGTAVFSIAQSSEEPMPVEEKRNHELKVNMGYAIFEILELNYELILDNDFSVGLAANYWFAPNADINFQVIPNFRFYPIESMRGYGFFIEANASFMTLNDHYYSELLQREVEETNFGGGMGMAAGYKFVSKVGFVVEVYTGLGRVFGNENVELYPRLGITMGKRF